PAPAGSGDASGGRLRGRAAPAGGVLHRPAANITERVHHQPRQLGPVLLVTAVFARQEVVAVVGAGTMGAGIAQVAALAGHRVLLADAVDGAAGRAIGQIRERVEGQVAKGRL